MTTKIIPRVGAKMRQALMAAVTAPDVLKLLKKDEAPSEELVAIIKQLEMLVKEKPADGKTMPSLEGIYDSLKKLKEKPGPVMAAIKLLDKVYGKKATGKVDMPDIGNLPFFELLRGTPAGESAESKPALQASVGGVPGTYRARLIRAGTALDKKNWRAEALQAAVNRGLFEGVPLKVFSYGGEYGPVEYHLPLTDSDFAGSTVGNQVGFVQNATWDAAENAVFGDICVTDPARQALIDAMLSKGLNPPGLSIYCEGDMDTNMDVNEIARVHSMDLVTWPAAEGAILGVQALQASWLGFLGAADGVAQEMPEGGQQPKEGEVPSAEPTANESVTAGTWKSERNSQLDFFTSLANFVRERVEAGEFVDAGGVGTAYDKWAGAWEASQDTTFEEFMAGFWGNPENANLLKRQESAPEEQGEDSEGSVEKAAPQQATQQELNLPQKQPVGASSTGGTRVSINGKNVELEKRLRRIEDRVAIVDSEATVDQKLAASGLPSDVQDVIRKEFAGRPISRVAVDGLIDASRKTIATLEAGLAEEAAVSIEGRPLSGGANAQDAMNKILGFGK